MWHSGFCQYPTSLSCKRVHSVAGMTQSRREKFENRPLGRTTFFCLVFSICSGDLLPPVSNPTVTTSNHSFRPVFHLSGKAFNQDLARHRISQSGIFRRPVVFC